MTIEQWLKDVYYDKWGTCIWSKDEDGGSQMVADIRGWGVLQYMFKTNEEAERFHDEVGEFIVEAIKEKLQPLPKQELYTEEQVREAIEMAREQKGYASYEYTENQIIQSLKQPK